MEIIHVMPLIDVIMLVMDNQFLLLIHHNKHDNHYHDVDTQNQIHRLDVKHAIMIHLVLYHNTDHNQRYYSIKTADRETKDKRKKKRKDKLDLLE
jgi:hypothetical protein